MINEYTKNRNIPLGKIDIMKNSLFEVPSNFTTDILAGLSHANWNGNKVNVEVSQIQKNSAIKKSEKKKELMIAKRRLAKKYFEKQKHI